MSNDIRVSNPNSNEIYNLLLNKTEKKQEVPKETQTVTELPAIDSRDSETHTSGKVPASNVSFDELPPLQTNDDLQSLPEENSDELPPLAVFEDGQAVSQDPNDLPNIDGLGTHEEQVEDYQPETSKSHSTAKAVAHLEAHLLKAGLGKLSTKIIQKSTEKAVAKELTEILAKVATTNSARASATVAARVTEGAALGVAKTVAEVTGKGVATVGVKEASKAAGNIIKGISNSGKAATEILLKDGATKILSNSANALVKTSVGAGEKVLQVGIEEGSKIAVKKVLEKAGAEVTGKVVGKATEKATAEAVAKATTEVAAKGSTKFANKLAAAAPWIGTAIGVGITAWDTMDAIEKTKDPNASKASAALAWTTVGLDVVSTTTTATGVGAPIGWAATGLSIGTSILSDYLR